MVVWGIGGRSRLFIKYTQEVSWIQMGMESGT